MQVTIDGMQLAQLAGAVQGFLLAVVLAAHRTNRIANRLLAALMVSFAVSLLSEVYYSAGLVGTMPHFFGISYPLPWTFGPLVYLYAVAAGDRTWRFGWRGAVHFAPAVIVVVLTLPFYLLEGAEKRELFARLTAGDTPTLLAVLDPFKYVSGLAYSAVTLSYLRAHRRRVEDSYSNTERVNLRWLQTLAGTAAVIWLLAAITGVAGILPVSIERNGNSLVSLAVALVVYAIGYMGLRQPEIFQYDGGAPAEEIVESTGEHAREIARESRLSPSDGTDARYERSGLGASETQRLKAALLMLMATEHPHRDPELTLPDLAGRLESTPHKLSELLNRELSQTFYDFVNGYRVQEVCRRLADPTSKQRNILALGLDAGFASKSTFNQAFKKLTGETPSGYRSTLEAQKTLGGYIDQKVGDR